MNQGPPTGPASWHASTALLDRFARIDLDPARAASVEQHLLDCAGCRERLRNRSASASSTDPLEPIWLDIVDEIDRPRIGAIPAVLARLGVAESTARFVAATPALRLAWLASIGFVLGFVVLIALTTTADSVLLIAAPIIPLAGIGAAYGAGADPLHELVRSAPVAGSRVFLARALAVLATALPLTLAASFVVPIDRPTALAWLAPALGLAGLTLALSTWVEPRWAAGIAAIVWLGGLLVAWSRTAPLDGARLTAALPFRPSGQVASLTLAAVGALVFWHRQASFDEPALNPVEPSSWTR